MGVSSPWGQQPYAVRLDWGMRGARELVTGGVSAVVVVDVLSFTTSVTVAVERGTAVWPHPWDADSGAARAAELDAVCAVGRTAAGAGEISLSPASIVVAAPVERLVLPSPNGSAICAALVDAGVEVVAASLRNAAAVGQWLADRDGPVGVVAAGERWPDDDSLRPAVEDLWGAGAVVAAFVAARPGTTASPEAQAARTASEAVRADPLAQLSRSASGVELEQKGFGADLAVAAELDVSSVVPVLTDGWLVGQGACGSTSPLS